MFFLYPQKILEGPLRRELSHHPQRGAHGVRAALREGDFVGTLRLVTFFGFDTDCNAGNLGTVLGVFTQLKGVDYDVWIAPLHDTAICSSVLGYENIVPAPAFAYDVFRTALRLRGRSTKGSMPPLFYRTRKRLHTISCSPAPPRGCAPRTARASATGRRVGDRAPACGARRVFVKTYYGKADFSDNRYDPATSPKAYRGQTLCADYEADEGAEVRLYYQNLRNGKCYLSRRGAREVRMTCEEDASSEGWGCSSRRHGALKIALRLGQGGLRSGLFQGVGGGLLPRTCRSGTVHLLPRELAARRGAAHGAVPCGRAALHGQAAGGRVV